MIILRRSIRNDGKRCRFFVVTTRFYLCPRLKEFATSNKELRRTILLVIIVTRHTENRKFTILWKRKRSRGCNCIIFYRFPPPLPPTFQFCIDIVVFLRWSKCNTLGVIPSNYSVKVETRRWRLELSLYRTSLHFETTLYAYIVYTCAVLWRATLNIYIRQGMYKYKSQYESRRSSQPVSGPKTSFEAARSVVRDRTKRNRRRGAKKNRKKWNLTFKPPTIVQHTLIVR